MPCFHPQTAFQPLEGGPLVWHEKRDHRQITIPCRQCAGCRLKYSAEWATRCIHEAKTHEHNCWLTLTYDDNHLPSRYNTGIIHPRTKEQILSGSLYKAHPQKFLRALRKALGRRKYKSIVRGHQLEKPTLRYYYSGEYGEKYHRPHYHLCLFGIDFSDKILERTTDTGYKLYTSEIITKIWKHGTHMIGELTWESAAYTARYIMKKINGKRKKEHYKKIDLTTGEIIDIIPEYNDMSRKPGIAQPWLQKFLTDVYPHDRVIVRGHKTKPPRYYDKHYQKYYPDQMEEIKYERLMKTLNNWENYTDPRLKAEEIITARKIQSIKQKF